MRDRGGYLGVRLLAFLIAFFVLSPIYAQQRVLGQKAIDAVKSQLEKKPTAEQLAELLKIEEQFLKKYDLLHKESERLAGEFDRATQDEGFSFSKEHIKAAVNVHGRLRSLYLMYLKAIEGWGQEAERFSCVRQVGRMRIYTISVSNQYKRKAEALPLGSLSDRIYANLYVRDGGAETFNPDPEPTANSAGLVHRELASLVSVCKGLMAGYKVSEKKPKQ